MKHLKQWLLTGTITIVLLGLTGVLIWLPVPKPEAVEPVQTPDAAAEESSVPERLITLQNDGEKARTFRVVKEWTIEDGRTAQEVECVDTGERLTLLDSPADDKAAKPSTAEEKAEKPQ